MGHNDKDNKFNVFEFDVVSRIEQSILEDDNDSNQEEPADSTGDIVYEFTKNEGKVDMSMKINAESQNNTGQVGNGYTQNSDYNVTALIKTDEGSINISGMGEIGFKDPKFK